MGTIAVQDQDGQGTTSSSTSQVVDAAIQIPNTTPVVLEKASLTSFDADGFTLNWATTSSTAFHYIYIALKGVTAKVGSTLTQTSLGTWSETGIGFKPKAGIFLTAPKAFPTIVSAHAPLSIGFASDAAEQYVNHSMSLDDQDTSAAATTQNDALIYQRLNASLLVRGAAAFSSWNPDGFTLNMTDADPAEYEMLYLVLG